MNKNFTVALVFLVIITLVGVGALALFGNQSETAENEEGGIFSSLFPFLTNPITGLNGSDTPAIVEESGPVPILRLVSEKPVAGASFTSSGAIRYVERETGHIYETPADSLTTVRISNTTIPGIQEVVFVDDGRIILRYLDGENVESFSGFLASSTPDQGLTGQFLEPANHILRASENNILIYTKTLSGSRIDSAQPDGTAPRTIFSSPIHSWIPSIAGGEIFLTVAPTGLAPGYMYKLVGGKLEKIFGGMLGLMTLPSPGGRYVAFSASGSDRGIFGVYDRSTGEAIPLPAGTFAPKCAWLTSEEPVLLCGVPSSIDMALSPDNWLMGEVGLTDRLWLLYPESRTAQILSNVSEEARTPIDVINPTVSPSGAYVLFTNKHDSSLWSLTLSPNQ